MSDYCLPGGHRHHPQATGDGHHPTPGLRTECQGWQKGITRASWLQMELKHQFDYSCVNTKCKKFVVQNCLEVFQYKIYQPVLCAVLVFDSNPLLQLDDLEEKEDT